MAQVAPDRAPRAESTEPVYKYSVYGGYSYTSLNQVNQSRYGLSGLNFDVSRDWGKYFALTADGAFFWYAFRSGNPGNPSVSMVLFGPELHAPLYGKVGGFFRGMIGGEHRRHRADPAYLFRRRPWRRVVLCGESALGHSRFRGLHRLVVLGDQQLFATWQLAAFTF